MEYWLYFLLAGVLVLVFFVFLFFQPKYRIDGPMLGMLTLGVLLIGVYVFRPTIVKFQGWELVNRVETVEKNQRPFAVFLISDDAKISSKGVLYSTFKKGQIEFGTFSPPDLNYTFTLKPIPKLAEVRCIHVSVAIVSEVPVDGGMKYTYRFTSNWSIRPDKRCIVEAFF